jgi:hypothetical protein
MNEDVLRDELVKLLTEEQGHVQFEAALEGVAPGNRHRRAPGLEHTVWELLEHLRIAQEDILRYSLDAAWRELQFPRDYWPSQGPADDAAWEASIAAFLRDRGEVVDMARDRGRDLTAQVPHGGFRTYLRQVLLVADHNAYHLGQIVQVRRALGDWPAS